jgi:heterotetrameric sarcosine oxidase gamma subunit
MSPLLWMDTLDAPRSLAAADGLAIVILEDPGVVEVRAHTSDTSLSGLEAALGGFPREFWQAGQTGEWRTIRQDPGHWLVLGPRESASQLSRRIGAGSPDVLVTDATGGYSLLRIMGADTSELMLRLCCQDLSGVQPDDARGTVLAGVQCLLIRERAPLESWLVLVPRSWSTVLSERLVRTAELARPLGLFKPAPPPPV